MNWRSKKTPHQYTNSNKYWRNKDWLKKLKMMERHEVQQGEVQDPAFGEEWSHVHAEEHSTGEQLCRKEAGGPGGDRNVPLQQRQQMRSCAVVMYFQWVERGNSPLLSTGEATPGVLGSLLGSSMKDRHGHTEDCPANGHKDEKNAEFLLWGKANIRW